MIDIGSIITAFITGGLALLGVIITVRQGNDRLSAELKEHQAVQDEKISHLTEEVKKHNSFAERIPRLEEHIDNIDRQIEDLKEGRQ